MIMASVYQALGMGLGEGVEDDITVDGSGICYCVLEVSLSGVVVIECSDHVADGYKARLWVIFSACIT
jgi:hypothetical protein